MEAARTLFAAHGLAVPLDKIARDAVVSIGTLYHHFGDREHLIDQAMTPLVEQSVAHAHEALTNPDPYSGLISHLHAIAQWQAHDRAFTDICVTTILPDSAIEQAKAKGHELTELVHRARQAGVLRPDVTLTDIGLLGWSVVKATDSIRASAPDAWRRHLQILLDGLRPDCATPLPALQDLDPQH